MFASTCLQVGPLSAHLPSLHTLASGLGPNPWVSPALLVVENSAMPTHVGAARMRLGAGGPDPGWDPSQRRAEDPHPKRPVWPELCSELQKADGQNKITRSV